MPTTDDVLAMDMDTRTLDTQLMSVAVVVEVGLPLGRAATTSGWKECIILSFQRNIPSLDMIVCSLKIWAI